MKISLFAAMAPSFKKTGFGPFYMFKGTEGRLKCNPEAAPHPDTFRWYKGGIVLKTTPYRVESDGTLVIAKVNKERDEGEYRCFAKNILGEATAYSNATVYGKNDKQTFSDNIK